MKKETDCFHPIKIFSHFPQVSNAQEASSELMPRKGFTQFCNKKEGKFWQRRRLLKKEGAIAATRNFAAKMRSAQLDCQLSHGSLNIRRILIKFSSERCL